MPLGYSIDLGRVFGIRIGLNWSWFIVFVLVAWTYAAFVFPQNNEGLSTGVYWTMALVFALLFFTSVLLHELGHALQARREGVPIEGITLWLFGGVARFRGMYPSAGAEFRVAIAGPIVSAVIAAVLLGLAVLAPLPAAVDGVAFWLGWINAILLAFNLLPALPLDGGRVLHAGLWDARDDLGWATAVGAGIGRGFGYLMVGGGVALFLFGASLQGLWFVLLGWFLASAAAAEAQHIAAVQALRGLRVRDLMVRDPSTVSPDLTLGRFVDEVAWRSRHTTYPVVEDGGRALGLLPFRCVAQVPRNEWETRRVRDCMLPREQVPILDADELLVDALAELSEGGASRALVLEGDRLEGMLSITDVARALEVGAPRRLRRRAAAS